MDGVFRKHEIHNGNHAADLTLSRLTQARYPPLEVPDMNYPEESQANVVPTPNDEYAVRGLAKRNNL